MNFTIDFRQLIKCTGDKKDILLLGFRQRSLNSPSNSSPWTKLCEEDFPRIIKDLNHICAKNSEDNLQEWEIPEEMLRLEMHLSLPLKIHNMPKYLLQKDPNTEDVRYIDSHQLTILDIIVWISYTLIFEKIDLKNLLPFTNEWYHRMTSLLQKYLDPVLVQNDSPRLILKSTYSKKVPKRTFYKIETKREGIVQKFTVQKDIDSALKKIFSLGIDFCSKNPVDYTINFDWHSLPIDVNPFNGDLPNKRMLRKQQQLESMATEVVRISKKSDVIVDFCCGTGHLGILIACLLPDCHVILLDNNEESLVVRARAWVNKLGLTNVSFFLGNINYFNGNFNTGLSLHACGSATDIVLSKCWEKSANFVTCACCYGKICENNVTKYPQSKAFKSCLELDDFITIAHSADQGHDPPHGIEESILMEQGGLCTDIIDTDRKLKAEELGYKVTLKRLHPESCTPKNRLLVGVL